MNASPETIPIQRYIAIDTHKHYVMVGGMNQQRQWTLRPRKVQMPRFREWAAQNLRPGDAVVLETTANVWDIYDIVAPLVSKTVVANAYKVRQIAEARVKTDKADIKRLITLLIANIVPEVWVPPMHVRELRALISFRWRLGKQIAMSKNRMHSVSHQHHLGHPKGKRFQEKDMAWREQLADMERFQLEMDLETKQYLKKQIDRLTQKLGTMSHQAPWSAQALYLMQLPGFGVVTTMTVLAAICDITRFETSKHLVSYAGLAPGVAQSGTKQRAKPITKEGRKELRWAMVEVAWRAVRADPVWKRRFEELKRRKHPNDAITIIAHQLLIVVWHVLTRQQPYRHYTTERIAFKFLYWSWQLDEEQRRRLPRSHFARYYLMRLGIGDELQRVALDPKHPHRLATVEQLQSLFPELVS